MADYPVAVNGLVKELADIFLAASPREYPTFAIASAMQAIATAAQGTFLLPDGRPLCLYQLLLAPASVGKGGYVGTLKNLLFKTSEQMIGGEPGSREGLRRLLLEWNARLFVIDEIQEFFGKMADENPHIKGIGTDLKEIWSGVECLQSIATKASITHSVKLPFAGFYGTGTTSETAQFFSGSVAGGGLVSRFAVFVVDEAVEVKRAIDRPDLTEVSGKLYEIFHAGKTPEWKQRGFPDWYEYRKRLLDPKGCTPEGPQVMPKKRLSIEQGADDILWEQRKLWERFILGDATSPEGPIWDRAGTMALIYASLHAIGRRKSTITLEDVNVGIDFAKLAAEASIELSNKYGGETSPDRDAKKILRVLAKAGPMTKRELSRASRLSGKRFAEALGGLIAAQNVVPTSDKFAIC
jgi:hypothetical protein